MKIVVTCGGTGGHAFPGLAVAEELRRRGHEVSLWASGRDIESSVLSGWDGPGFSTGAKQISAKNAFAILCSVLRCFREMKRFRPSAVLAMGSYSSLPPVLAARMCRVPVVLHEANTVPGRAVDLLSRFAKKVAISFAETAKYLSNADTVRTGLPIRGTITKGSRFEFIPPDAFTVFVTGGSQGAHAVNELMTKAIVALRAQLPSERKLYVIHQTGSVDEAPVVAAYSAAGIPARVHAFEREMANAFASADVVVARAGASTCFELAACGKPALLIPLPTAMRDHQHYNADAFAARGAADEGRQSELKPQDVARYLRTRIERPELLRAMSEKIRALAEPEAAVKVADLVESAANLV